MGHRLRQHVVSGARPGRSRWRRAAEAAGFESLWCPEHVVVAVGRGRHALRGLARRQDGPPVAAGRAPRPARLAGVRGSQTTTINLGTNVVIVPEHQPAVLAKSVATLDALSGGRVRLGDRRRRAARGVRRRRHGVHQPRQRMDEYIEAMRLLWEEEVATYHGQFVAFDEVRCDPSPPNGTIPLHIGGASPAAVRRAAAYGDGYFPWVGPRLDSPRHASPGDRRRARREPSDWAATPTRSSTRSAAPAPSRKRNSMAALGVDRLTIAIRAKEIAAGARRAGPLRRRGHRADAGSVTGALMGTSTARWPS